MNAVWGATRHNEPSTVHSLTPAERALTSAEQALTPVLHRLKFSDFLAARHLERPGKPDGDVNLPPIPRKTNAGMSLRPGGFHFCIGPKMLREGQFMVSRILFSH